MDMLNRHKYIVATLVCSAGLGLFLTLTSPEEVSIGLLVIPVILLFFIVFSALQAAFSGLNLLVKRPRKKRTVSLVGASMATVVMILQSTGGISAIDTILLGLIVLVASIYISKF